MKKILVVDDSESSRYLLGYLFRSQGFRVFEASDGAEAVLMAARERPDLVLMDVHLPGMDGLTATGKILGMAEMEKVPVIAVSAAVGQANHRAAFEAGCFACIDKPIEPDKLLGTVRSVFEVVEKIFPPSVPPAAGSVTSAGF